MDPQWQYVFWVKERTLSTLAHILQRHCLLQYCFILKHGQFDLQWSLSIQPGSDRQWQRRNDSIQKVTKVWNNWESKNGLTSKSHKKICYAVHCMQLVSHSTNIIWKVKLPTKNFHWLSPLSPPFSLTLSRQSTKQAYR